MANKFLTGIIKVIMKIFRNPNFQKILWKNLESLIIAVVDIFFNNMDDEQDTTE